MSQYMQLPDKVPLEAEVEAEAEAEEEAVEWFVVVRKVHHKLIL